MRSSRLALSTLAVAAAFAVAGAGSAGADALWQTSVPLTNEVVSKPVVGGGYPFRRARPPPTRAPAAPGATTRTSRSLGSPSSRAPRISSAPRSSSSRRSPTFYDFHLGSFTIEDGPVDGEPGPGLRLHLHRHPGDAAELDQQHRPERRLRHQGPRLPGDAALQRLLGQPAPELEHRRLLQRRPRPALGHRATAASRSSRNQLVQHRPRVRRGQAVGGRQPHPRQPLPGPRLRRLGDLQRPVRPRSRSPSRATAGRRSRRRRTITAPSETGPSTSTSTPRSTPPGTSTSRSASDRRAATTEDDLRDALDRRRRHLVAFHAGREASQTPAAACRTRPSATASSSTSPPAPTTPATSTWSGRTGTAASTTSSSRSRPTSVRTGPRRSWSTTTPMPAPRPTSSSPRWRPGRTGRSRSTSTTAARPARTTRASCPRTSGGRTSASTSRCRRSRTAAAAPCRSAATSASRSSPGTRSSRTRRSTGSTRWRARRTKTPAPPARFIGDYFGLAISATNVYTLAVSTHYPSAVTADDGGPVYYQQQVLETVSRGDLGI